MTDMNNIMTAPIVRAPAPAQMAANGEKTPLLSDFIGMVLSPQGQPLDAATLQNLPQDVQQVAEKIAAMLQGAPVDAAPADISFDQLQGAGILPALTSDLTASLSAALQSEAPMPVPAAVPAAPAALQDGMDMNALGAMLNGIEPTAGADTPDMPAISGETAEVAGTDADNLLMLQLMQAVKTPLQGQAPAAVAAPAPAEKPAANAAMPQQAETPLPQQNMMQDKTAAQPQAAPQDNKAAAPQPAAASAQNAAAPAQQPAAPKAETALNTLLAAMAAQNNDGIDLSGSSMGGGFGQNGFGAGFAAADSAATHGLFVAQAGNSQFAQYMQTGNSQSLPAQTSEMIALQIQRNAAAKVDTFTLQLEPADLGRMDIELKFGHDGTMKAHLSVERPETLALLQKDAVQLERLLQQSGLNTDGQSLSFDLRQQSGGERGAQTGAHDLAPVSGRSAGIETVTNDNNDTITRGYIGPRGVNIMV